MDKLSPRINNAEEKKVHRYQRNYSYSKQREHSLTPGNRKTDFYMFDMHTTNSETLTKRV